MKIHTKRRKANNNEPWIGELLDEVSEDKLLEMSAIRIFRYRFQIRKS